MLRLKHFFRYILLYHPVTGKILGITCSDLPYLQTLLIDDRDTDKHKYCMNEKDSALMYSCLQFDVPIRLITASSEHNKRFTLNYSQV